MFGIRNERREKLGITYFGLLGHEIALIESAVKNAPTLSGDYELREPGKAGACGVVLVNKDSRTATSWWKNYKRRHPAAIPLLLTNSRQETDDSTCCKRPFSPAVFREALSRIVAERAA